ncbi:hypothetical protein QAD02_019314 [Eretmocerus hayati]|uniref:Uncharacterized protein n=1 Tax=Eretmocerus hayati TaxID=131215 RepID=A0ACC2PJ92_9HYME|nr:hypothetical protein QAD02_019314 [Eretmocerus hayati]
MASNEELARELAEAREKIALLEQEAADQQQILREETIRRRAVERDQAGAHAEAELDVAVALLSLGDATRAQTQQFLHMQQQTTNALLAERRPASLPPNVQTAIRDFDKIEGPEQADAWIRELEIMKNVNSWSDPVAFNVAKAHLKNAALKWYLTKFADIVNYNELLTSFKATFCASVSKGDKLRLMLARVQGNKELLPDYVFDKIWLCNGLDMNPREIRDEIAAGLWSKDLANHLMSREFDSTDSILPEMMRFEKFNTVRQERVAGKRQAPISSSASFNGSRGNSSSSSSSSGSGGSAYSGDSVASDSASSALVNSTQRIKNAKECSNKIQCVNVKSKQCEVDVVTGVDEVDNVITLKNDENDVCGPSSTGASDECYGSEFCDLYMKATQLSAKISSNNLMIFKEVEPIKFDHVSLVESSPIITCVDRALVARNHCEIQKGQNFIECVDDLIPVFNEKEHVAVCFDILQDVKYVTMIDVAPDALLRDLTRFFIVQETQHNAVVPNHDTIVRLCDEKCLIIDEAFVYLCASHFRGMYFEFTQTLSVGYFFDAMTVLRKMLVYCINNLENSLKCYLGVRKGVWMRYVQIASDQCCFEGRFAKVKMKQKVLIYKSA